MLPALLATLFYYLILWNPERDLLQDFKNTFIYGSPPLPQLWFVIVILLFYLVFWFSFRFFGEKGIYGLVLGAVLLFLWTYKSGFGRNWWITVFAFPTGAFLAKYERPLFSFCEKSFFHWGSLLATLVILFVVLYILGNPFLWTLCYVIIPIGGVLFFARLPRRVLDNRVLLYCGAVSYELYLCHQIPIEFFKSSLFPVSSDLVYALLVLTFSFILAITLQIIISILPDLSSLRRN